MSQKPTISFADLVRELSQQTINLDSKLRVPATRLRNLMGLPSLDAAATLSIEFADKILSNFMTDDGMITFLDPDTDAAVSVDVKGLVSRAAKPKDWKPLTKGPGRDTPPQPVEPTSVTTGPVS